MFAHQVVDFIGPAGVHWNEIREPEAGDGVIIHVVAAGVSFADLLQTQGRYQLNLVLPFTPGMDAAGVVRSAPPGAGIRAGQRVAVLLSHGCWQEVLAADPRRVLALPDDLSFEAGAAAPLNYLTGLFALVRRGRAQAGETLLVHGGAGGVGVAAIQLGRALGLQTIAVTSDDHKRNFALRCGAHHAILSDGWLDAVRGLVGDRAVDIVVDPVGGDRMTDSLRSLAPEGRLLVLGFTAGEIPTPAATVESGAFTITSLLERARCTSHTNAESPPLPPRGVCSTSRSAQLNTTRCWSIPNRASLGPSGRYTVGGTTMSPPRNGRSTIGSPRTARTSSAKRAS
ncbi:MAG: zinc-binding dehydrogenase [Pseudonocardiaceae bacterium]